MPSGVIVMRAFDVDATLPELLLGVLSIQKCMRARPKLLMPSAMIAVFRGPVELDGVERYSIDRAVSDGDMMPTAASLEPVAGPTCNVLLGIDALIPTLPLG
jgi:hypothetical protein